MLNRLNTKGRFALLGALILFLVVLLVVTGSNGYWVVRQKARIAAQLQQQGSYLTAVMRGAGDFSLTEGTPAPRQDAAAAMEKFDRGLAELFSIVEADEIHNRLTHKIAPGWKLVRAEAESFFSLDNVSPFNTESMVAYGRLAVNAAELLSEVEAASDWEQNYADEVMNSTQRFVGTLAAMTLVFTALLLYLIYLGLARPLTAMAALARRAAGGELTCNFATERTDEIGVLSNAFEEMTGQIRQMLTRAQSISEDLGDVSKAVSSTSEKVVKAAGAQQKDMGACSLRVREMDGFISSMAARSQALHGSAEQLSLAASGMARSIAEVARRSQAYGRVQEQTTTAVTEMIDSFSRMDVNIQGLSSSSVVAVRHLREVEGSIQEIQHKAAESALLAGQMLGETTGEGLPAMTGAVEGILEIRERIKELAEAINRLGERSRQIGRIVSMIDEIADQTKLLSLNASIIAAQSGEYGHAFGVVAEEIKALAQKTTLSTQEVETLVITIQSETNSSMALAEEGLGVVEKGRALMEGASRVFGRIRESAQSSNHMALAIKETTTNQAASVRQIATDVLGMAQLVDKIYKASGNHAEEGRSILESVDETRRISQEVGQEMKAQVLVCSQISTAVEGVFVMTEQTLGDIESHRRQSSGLIESIQGAGSRAITLAETATESNRSIDALERDIEQLQEELRRFRL